MLVLLSQIMRPEIKRDSQISKLIFPDICNLLFYLSLEGQQIVNVYQAFDAVERSSHNL